MKRPASFPQLGILQISIESRSRSKHTDPTAIRASRRVRDPFARRSAGDLSTRRSEQNVTPTKELQLPSGCADHSSGLISEGKRPPAKTAACEEIMTSRTA